MDLLNQLEHILECDPLIDEIGFLHPSQFAKMNEEAASSEPSSIGDVLQPVNGILRSDISEIEALKQVDTAFWNRNHKLGISVDVLVPLYKTAKHAFMVACEQYRKHTDVYVKRNKSGVEDALCSGRSLQSISESDIMKHSKVLLLLSSDFGTAWNSRKLLLSDKQDISVFMDELLLSALVLSYSPKSDSAWSHRRWAIKMIAGKRADMQGILAKESELVEKIAEKSKMNYRAWNHRCQLVAYMGGAQALQELEKSRNWAALHVADNSCFHYRRKLLLRLLDDCCKQDCQLVHRCYGVWKEELDWNEILIKRYIGREALWLHRRFLSLIGMKHFSTVQCGLSCPSNGKQITNYQASWESELQLLQHCATIPDSDFEDFRAQAVFSCTYILWLTKQIDHVLGIEILGWPKVLEVKTLLQEACPERALFWDTL